MTIYGLVDPRTNVVRYVGRTANLKQRIAGHLSSGASRLVKAWIAEMKAAGLVPAVVVLDECDDQAAAEREAHWIERHSGPELFNRVKFSPLPRASVLPAHDVNRVAITGMIGARSVSRYLRGDHVHYHTRLIVEGALRKLGLTPGATQADTTAVKGGEPR